MAAGWFAFSCFESVHSCIWNNKPLLRIMCLLVYLSIRWRNHKLARNLQTYWLQPVTYIYLWSYVVTGACLDFLHAERHAARPWGRVPIVQPISWKMNQKLTMNPTDTSLSAVPGPFAFKWLLCLIDAEAEAENHQSEKKRPQTDYKTLQIYH